MCRSNDTSYYFKFWDVYDGEAYRYVCGNDGYI